MYKQRVVLLLLAGIMASAYGVNPQPTTPNANPHSQAPEQEHDCQICTEKYNQTEHIRVKFDCPGIREGSREHAMCQACALRIARERNPSCPTCRAPLKTHNAIRLDNGELVTEEYNLATLPDQTKNELYSLLLLVPASENPYVSTA